MTTALIFLSVLFPAKGWYGADQAWNVTVRPPQGIAVKVLLTEFTGSSLDPTPGVPFEFDKEGVIELKRLYPAVASAGTYLLYAVPKDQQGHATFLGTPLVVSVREDRRRGAPTGPMVVRIEPLVYGIISTDVGDMTVAFFYDVAPNTIDNFISLAREGFYDGLTFHRIEPGFLVQGGDPRGDGTGGPGYNIDAEFSDRKHEEGALSMARNVDPNESPNNPPRPEYANSAGSQFFISLDYKNTAQLDGAYTIFGRVIGDEGRKTLAAIAAAPVPDKKTARPAKPPVIKKIEIFAVATKANPYRTLLAPTKPSTTDAGKTPEPAAAK
jgi:peptidyl-prolyl cis-trans isomerase B (cyclophilin B)